MFHKVLLDMIELLKSPEAWSKKEILLNEEGEPTLLLSEAKSFHLIGALVFLVKDNQKAQKYLRKLCAIMMLWSESEQTRFENLSSFNEHPETTHQDVMRFLNYAAAITLEDEKLR